jgi:hypothetical protein
MLRRARDRKGRGRDNLPLVDLWNYIINGGLSERRSMRDGQRLVGYDNERGKGDHKHIGGREHKYRFTDIDTLVRDFLRDVEKLA